MSEPRRWGVIVACGLLFVIAHWLPLPGVDGAALAELSPGWLGMPAFGALPGSLAFLIALRGARALAERERPRPAVARLAAAVWVLLAAPSAIFIATYLEGASDEAWEIGLLGVVPDPGLLFRLGVLLTRCAGAALVWQLAEWIKGTELASGTLVLALVVGALELASSVTVLAEDASVLEMVAIVASLALASLALAALAGVAWARPPRAWPVRVPSGLRLRSTLDVVVVPVLVGTWLGNVLVTAVAHGLVPGVGPEASVARAALPSIASTVAGAGATVALVIPSIGITVLAIASALAWRGRVTQGDASAVGARGRVGAIVPAGMFAAAALALVAWVVTGGAERALAPAPWAGTASFQVIVALDGPADPDVAAHDAAAIRARIERAGMDGDVQTIDPSRLRIVLRGVRDGDVLRDLLVPHRLGLHAVVDEPAGEQVGVVLAARAGSIAAHFEGSAGALAGLATPPGTGLARIVECPDDDPGGPCSAWVVAAEPAISNADVLDAEALVDPGSGMPYVSLRLDPEGAAAFSELTAAHVREQLAIVVDGRAVSVPVVQSRIEGGIVQITLGRLEDFDVLAAEAQSLADALSAQAALEGDWTIESIADAP